MSPRRVLGLASRIISQFRHDPRTIAFVFLVPLVILTILTFILNNTSQDITLGIVPPPAPYGAPLVAELTQKLPPHMKLKTLDTDGVDSALKAGDASGALIFPADFATQMLSSGASTVALRLEGSNPPEAAQLKQIANLIVSALAQARPAAGAPGASQTTPGAAPTITLDTTYLYGGAEYTQTDALAPLLVGLFSFFFVFLLTSVAFLRERSQGTLERLRVSPLSKAELVLGYVLGFTLFAFMQSVVILLYVIYVLQVHYRGNIFLLFLITITLTIAGVNLGIFVSAFARNELQIIQFIPLVLVPQILLGGLFFPVSTLPVVLHQLAYIMPLTYANFALRDVMLKGFGWAEIWPDVVFLIGFALLMVFAAAASLRQEKE